MRRLAQRTEAVVSLSALEHNVRRIREIIGDGVEIRFLKFILCTLYKGRPRFSDIWTKGAAGRSSLAGGVSA